MTAALILTGAPGAGKSSVLDALGTLLEIEGIEYGAIESEELARGWPWLSCSEWLKQLEAVMTLQRAAGRSLLLVAATTETTEELRGVIDAVGADDVGTFVGVGQKSGEHTEAVREHVQYFVTW